MGQSFDRPGGQGGLLPKPTPPPRKSADFRDDPTDPEMGGNSAQGNNAQGNRTSTNDTRLPPVSAPPRKIGSVPEMSVFNGLARNGWSDRPSGENGTNGNGSNGNGSNGNSSNGNGSNGTNGGFNGNTTRASASDGPVKTTLSGGFGPLPRPSAPPGRASLPPVAPPPRRGPDSMSETVTKVRSDGSRSDAPPAADTVRNNIHDAPTVVPEDDVEAEALDWDEEEESTHVFGNGNGSPSSPPADDLGATRVREAAPSPRPSVPGGRTAAPPSSRAPRLVPPSPPSKATLLGVHPSELTGRPSMPAWPAPAATGFPAISARGSLNGTQPQNGAPFTEESSANGGRRPGSQPGYAGQPGYDANGQNPGQYNAAGMPQPFGGASAYAQSSPTFPTTDEPGFVRLPSGRPANPTEMALRKPVMPIASEPSVNRSSKRMALGIAVTTAVIAAAAASAFLLIRRPGTLQVDVRDPKGATVAVAEVYVDGKKVCESTPCIVRDIESGPRAVRVVANGFANEEPTTVDVGSGTVTTLPVLLKAALGTLIAQSDQPGLRMFVDGTERGPLPARFSDITPGTHQIRIAGGERYKPLERAIDAKAGEPVDLGNVRLAVLRGKITVVLKTDGASIVLIPNDDSSKAKVLDGPFPRAIEVETTSGTWKLVAKKKGLPDFVAPLDFSDGVAEKTLEVALKEKDKDVKADAVSASTPTPTPGPGPAPVAKAEPVAKTEPKPSSDSDDSSDKGSSDKGGMGFLNINSLPVSRILLDGQPMGETPKTGVQVSPGTHTITFVNPDLPKKSVSVTVKAGETKTASAKLRD